MTERKKCVIERPPILLSPRPLKTAEPILVVENVDSSFGTFFELYRYPYRYWFLVEWVYELVNWALITFGQRYCREIYWANLCVRVIYVMSHLLLTPSIHCFHNVLSVSTCGIIFDSLIICAGLPEPELGVKVVTIVLAAAVLVLLLVVLIRFVLGRYNEI
jgi:hypothetical protein